MSKKKLPDIKELRNLLRYDPETGELFWLPRDASLFKTERAYKIWNTRYCDKPAGCIRYDGYIVVRLFNRLFRAHRVAWALHHGAWPADQIDHINGEPGHNRMANLREVTHQENLKNQKKRCDNTSGVVGVTWDKGRAQWRAQINDGGKNIHLGRFDSIEDAAAARAKAEIKHNYHTNHGRV
jgi:citrate synthase